MKNKVNLDLVSLKFIFDRNKAYIIPIIIILVSVILFFQFVIPEFSALHRVQQEAKQLSQELEIMKSNLNILSNADEDVLDSQLKTLTSALPLNKDAIRILNSIYANAQKTGVSLGAFSFVIGDISKPENAIDLPVVKLSVPIDADVIGVNSFIEIINKTVPLSEINSVKIGDKSSQVELSFYYKPLGNSKYSSNSQINPVSQKGLTLISQLNGFEDASVVATSSGQEQGLILTK
jgi:hypothetical protein